jgi:hypothetical protein
MALAGIGLTIPGLAIADLRKRGQKGEKMAVDLTGGLDPARELVLAEPPVTPGMRDAVNMWVWDDKGEIGLPRFAVEAVAPEWDNHQFMLSLAFPDGRLLRNWSTGPAHPVRGADGRPTRFGAGPLEFECIEPFRRYRTTYDGAATDARFGDFTHSMQPEGVRQAHIQFEIDCETAVPPWVQGTMSEDAKHMMSGGKETEFMGGDRLEQLCRAKGRIVIDGVERRFSGGALRVRRQGIRNDSGFWGHCWQSALFPGGKAFGYIAYPPGPDGNPSYNEGYIFLGKGGLIPARAVKSPWLDHFQCSGEDVSLEFETPKGRIRIEAITAMGMPTISRGAGGFPPLFQSIVRYRWDGEEAYGMMERSNLPERVRLPA